AAPTFLPYDGEQYVYFPNAAGNHVRRAGLSSFSRWEAAVRVRMDNPNATGFLCGGNTTFQGLGFNAAGRPVIALRDDTTTSHTLAASVGQEIPLAVRQEWFWLRGVA